MNLFEATKPAEAIKVVRRVAHESHRAEGTLLIGGEEYAAMLTVCDELERLQGVIRIGRQMREAQRSYFRERGQDALTQSKHLERQFDAAVKED